MLALSLTTVLQVIVGLGLLNVWLIRSGSSTRYRGGGATTLKEEFHTYGLPTWFFVLTGALKIGSGALLLASLWFPALLLPAATVVVLLMLGALAMHVRIKDPAIKAVPAMVMLAMSVTLVGLQIG